MMWMFRLDDNDLQQTMRGVFAKNRLPTSRQRHLLKAFADLESYDDEFRITGAHETTFFQIGPDVFRHHGVGRNDDTFPSSGFVSFMALIMVVFSMVLGYRIRRLSSSSNGTGVASKKSTARRGITANPGQRHVSHPNMELERIESPTVVAIDRVLRIPVAESPVKDKDSQLPVLKIACTANNGTDAHHCPVPALISEENSCEKASSGTVKDAHEMDALKDEFRSEVVTTAVAFKEVLEETMQHSGMHPSENTIATLAMQAAIAKKQSDDHLKAEIRGYHFEARQRNIDRGLADRRHGHVMASFREDKEWFTKISIARNECFYALRVALTRSVALLVGLRPVSTCMKISWYWLRSNSYTELISDLASTLQECPAGTTADELFHSHFRSLSWVTFFWDSFTPNVFKDYLDRSSCTVMNATSIIVYFLGFCTLNVAFRVCGLPSLSGSLLVLFWFADGLALMDAWIVLIVLLLAASAVYLTLHAYFLPARRKLRDGKAMSNEETSKTVYKYVSAKDTIEMTPLVVVLSHLLSVSGRK